ncbi:uncharacterized protein Z518_04143 [Rhinocladiella mackenziei CBS 650.93]|uniref:Rhinocladiella mackenziei CBS 650.93 unplaced genomic scaffold supercont1.3, whole genome shotgun sequence n=1 Tax=Rhinocladiella mackenziei CBS 650.93 TaxID=1442369 RepID=A0A0D2IKD4_9EURO|nr:uncharacterized protein Z518_04143 [Rhinocladiella mackenziei CBS 650.93]KIX06169.1 hypothetical protein Z518_04143 [Rhinocladiella mackenziei CBS 650.93]
MSSHTFFIGRTNLSYYTVPVAWLLCIAPHIYAVKLYDRISPKHEFDKVNPRSLLPTLESNPDIDTSTKRRIARAEAAQWNGFENLGFFAASVVAANVSGMEIFWVNSLSLAYIFSRVLFNVLYIKGVSGWVRSSVFHASSR